MDKEEDTRKIILNEENDRSARYDAAEKLKNKSLKYIDNSSENMINAVILSLYQKLEPYTDDLADLEEMTETRKTQELK
ncbi:hypothetical protein HI914_01508 [Erysiphe necator]|nr:hypothetical protein HI914_01508 [Erysiphe necator]